MADLVAESEAGRFDLTPLPTLMSVAARPPDNRLARDSFHNGVLDDLPRLPWVAAAALEGHAAVVAPSALLVGGAIVDDHLLRTAFPQPHVVRHGRRHPDPSVALEGLQFLAALEPSCVIDKATILQLLSPTDDHDPDLWPLIDADAVDAGFSALLEVLIALAERGDRKAFSADLAKLNGRFIPVVEEGGIARRLDGPQPVEGGPGRQALFVRTGEEASNQISVPAVLQMAFLPDQVIECTPVARLSYVGVVLPPGLAAALTARVQLAALDVAVTADTRHRYA